MPGDLLPLAQKAARQIEAARHPRAADIAADLSWAAFNLDAGEVGTRMLELLGSPQGTELMVLFGTTWEALETAGMSLGFGDAVTALDLCGDALYLASGGTPSADGRFKDIGYWERDDRRSSLRQATRRWIEQLLAAPRWDELFNFWRSAITHQRLTRHVQIGVLEPGGGGIRSLSRIAAPGSSATTGPDVLAKVTELLEFARDEVRKSYEAVVADYGKGGGQATPSSAEP